jgi:cytochrome c5
MTKKLAIILLMLGSMMGLLVSNVLAKEDPMSRENIIKRIEPVGQVRTTDAPDATPAATAPAPAKKVVTGESVYNQYCAVCHSAGVAGAPKFGDLTAWKSRGWTGAKNVAALTKSAIAGKNAMPAKGNCMDCSDKQIEQAIVYMVTKKSS